MFILRHFKHYFDRLDPTGVIYCHLHFIEDLAWCFFLAWCLSSCTRTVYQDREVVRHDSIYVTALSVDTILQRDSVHVLERGDTVRITEYNYIYKVKERTDTCYVHRIDTLTTTLTKVETKTVQKKDWLSIIGALCIGILTGFITLPFISRKS